MAMSNPITRLAARYGDAKAPLAGYAVLAGAFNLGLIGYLATRRHRLPTRIGVEDVLLLGVATHRLGRLIARDKVTRFIRAPFTHYDGPGDAPGEVEETPRGEGLQRAVGELVTCPTCVGLWVGAGLTGVYVASPPLARAIAAVFTVDAVASALNLAWPAVAKQAAEVTEDQRSDVDAPLYERQRAQAGRQNP